MKLIFLLPLILVCTALSHASSVKKSEGARPDLKDYDRIKIEINKKMHEGVVLSEKPGIRGENYFSVFVGETVLSIRRVSPSVYHEALKLFNAIDSSVTTSMRIGHDVENVCVNGYTISKVLKGIESSKTERCLDKASESDQSAITRWYKQVSGQVSSK